MDAVEQMVSCECVSMCSGKPPEMMAHNLLYPCLWDLQLACDLSVPRYPQTHAHTQNKLLKISAPLKQRCRVATNEHTLSGTYLLSTVRAPMFWPL